MSGTLPETPEELRMLAGEYVLGVLAGDQKRAVDQRVSRDPWLADEIAGWERQLSPMLSAVAEAAPPATLWARIALAKSLAPKPLAQGARDAGKPPPRLALVPSTLAPALSDGAGRPPVAPRRVWPWKMATSASMALAAGLAAFVLVPSLSHRQTAPMPAARGIALVAVLGQPERSGDGRPDTSPQMASDTGSARLVEPSLSNPDPAPAAGHGPGFVAAVWPDGTVVLTALAPMQVADGKTLELWIQPPDAAAPTSLGALPADGRQAKLPGVPANGTTLSVSLEPAGLSRTGAPSGRVLYIGTLRQPRG